MLAWMPAPHFKRQGPCGRRLVRPEHNPKWAKMRRIASALCRSFHATEKNKVLQVTLDQDHRPDKTTNATMKGCAAMPTSHKPGFA